MDAADIGQWMQESLARVPCGQFLEIDVSRFDGSLTVDALKAQYAAFRYMSGQHWTPNFEVDLVTRARCAYGKYRTTGTRKSGNADTSVGNSVLSVMFYVTVFYDRFQRLPGTMEFRIIVMGDDVLIRIHEKLVDGYLEQLLPDSHAAGLKCKVIRARYPRQVSFCSCHFYPLPDGGWRGCTKPGRIFVKMGYRLDPPVCRKTDWLWVRGCAFCLASEGLHVPLVRALALALCRIVFGHRFSYESLKRFLKHDFSQEMKVYDDRHAILVPKPLYQPPTFDTLASFATTYDITIRQIQDCEKWILSHTFLPIRLDHFVIRIVVSIDLADHRYGTMEVPLPLRP
jgi:hypothetical protein